MKYPVYIYHCDGHGMELVNLNDYLEATGGLDQQRTFTIQYSEVFENDMYGIWIRGSGSPLINDNYIYGNGRYGGTTPSHDGIHVNIGGVVSIHDNVVYGNAYGCHHNDGGILQGEVFTYASTSHPEFIYDELHGRNCFFDNTINLGVNRSSYSNYGYSSSGILEPYDGAQKKLSGSNVSATPASGTQVTNGSGVIWAAHNCWAPSYVVSGTVLTSGDYADCQNHDLPDCSPILGEPGSSPLAIGAVKNLRHILSSEASIDVVLQDAVDVLRSCTNNYDLNVAANIIGMALGVLDDSSAIATMNSYLLNNGSGWAYPESIRHAILTALLYSNIAKKNTARALELCDEYQSDFENPDYKKTGLLIRGMLRGGVDSLKSSAIASLTSILSTGSVDIEMLSLYYSLTHSLPPSVAKKQRTAGALKMILNQNYPNPFNPTTIFSYELLESADVKLYVTDIFGIVRHTLVDEYRSEGRHSERFDGSTYDAGVYFYVLESNGTRIVKRMILIK
jgi:parallel beta-helix repeat protein